MYYGLYQNVTLFLGRDEAQAVSPRLPISTAQYEPGSRHMGFMVEEVALGQIFSEYTGFLCHSFQ
jgi:hypothetical protein